MQFRLFEQLGGQSIGSIGTSVGAELPKDGGSDLICITRNAQVFKTCQHNSLQARAELHTPLAKPRTGGLS